MEVKLVTLSPVHIGTDERLTAYVDYIFEDGYLYYIDYDKLGKRIASLSDSKDIMNDFVKVVKKQADSKGRAQYDLQKFIKDNFATRDDLYSKKVKAYTEVTEEVQAQVKSAGRSYIPGSSLKGALRTAILAYHIKKEGYDVNQGGGAYIGEDIFGRFNDDVLKYLRVSDTNTLDPARVEIATTIRYHLEDFSRQMRMQKEVIPENTELDFRINGKAKDISERYNYLKAGQEREILKLVNKFSLDFLEKELDIITDITDLKAIKNKYINLINQAEQYQQNNKGAILRLGSGKGFYNNVILNYYDKNGREKILRKVKDDVKEELFPKTKSVVIRNEEIADILGWIKIEIN